MKLLPIVAMLAASSRSPAEVLYRGLPAEPDWELSDASYQAADGWLAVRSDQSNPYAALKRRHDGDLTFRATVRNSRECHWVALLARGVYRLEVNNQFVELRLLRKTGDEWKLVSQVGAYELYARNTQQFELRMVVRGSQIAGFIDDKRLVGYVDPEPVPPGGECALLSGWGTNCAWRDVSLSTEPDLREWPVESAPRPAPEGLCEVTRVRNLHDDGVYFDGEPVGLTYRLRNPGDAPRDLRLSLQLLDLWQRVVDETVERVALKPAEERELTVKFASPPRGCFKVALQVGTTAEDAGWLEDLGSFTVVSRSLQDRPRNPDSVFGGHMDGINLEWHLQAGRKIGLQWARCHDMLQQTWWRRIQPDGPEQWTWMDETQATVDRLGFRTSGEFMWTPLWATSAAPEAPGNRETYPPRNWDDLSRYAYETVSHYKGSIHVWEVWNEPHFDGFFHGTPEEYAKLLEVCYTAAKRADPQCFVLGGGGPTVRQYVWIERVLKAGGAAHMDGFSIHYLEPDLADERLPRLRKLLDDYGMRGPIWNSEETVPTTSFFDQTRADCREPEARYHFRNACFELVRCYMGNLANGVQRVFYYDQADPWRFGMHDKPRTRLDRGPISGTMWDEGRQFRPVAAAHAALAQVLEGRTFTQRLERGPLRVFIFECPDGAAAVQYADFPEFSRRERVRLALPAGASAEDFTVVDVMGNETKPPVEDGKLVLLLAREPVYLVCASAARLKACYEASAVGF